MPTTVAPFMVLSGSLRTMCPVEDELLHRFSDGTQMATLWRYNSKYHPLWRPRYLVLSGLSTAPLQGLAVAGAEGVRLLPSTGKPQ